MRPEDPQLAAGARHRRDRVATDLQDAVTKPDKSLTARINIDHALTRPLDRCDKTTSLSSSPTRRPA
jgi:hypothetical protein